MLPLPELNDQDLNTILRYALEQLQKENPLWTDFAIHDPGVTFLELFSVLKTGQMKQMDTLTVKSLEKFLILLGMERQKAVCAKSKAAFVSKEDCFLPKGYPLRAGNIIYETATAAIILGNRIIDYSVGSGYYPYEPKKTKYDISIFQKAGDCFTLGLEKPLPADTELHFYFALEETDWKRNPASDQFLPLSDVVWEYYDSSNGGCWKAIEVIQDETYGFLFDGNMIFRIQGNHSLRQRTNGAIRFDIRARCLRYGYETVPVLSHFFINSLDLEQKDTKCDMKQFSYSDFKRNTMIVTSYLAKEGTYILYVREGKQYIQAKEMGVAYMLLEKPMEGWRLVTSDRAVLEKAFSGKREEEPVLLLILYQKEFFESSLLGQSNGSIHQEFALQDYENALYHSFQLIVGTKQNGWKIWKKVERFSSFSGMDCIYQFHAGHIAIRFGNNQKGKAPASGSEIWIASLALTLAADGNIREQVLENVEQNGLQVFQYMAGTGGKSEETVTALLQRIKENAENRSRAVTKEDYCKLAMETPGLSIAHIIVLPLYRPELKGYPQVKEKNAVTLVIEPTIFTQNPIALEGYVKNVKRHINKYRLLTTKLYCMAAEYIPVHIYAEVQMDKKETAAVEKMKKNIMQYVSAKEGMEWGVTLYYGELCSILENMENVERIKYLQIETPSSKAEKNSFGDLTIPCYAKAYVKQCEIIVF